MSAGALEAVRDEAGSQASVGWIYNGYDPEDFVDAVTDVAESSPPAPTARQTYRLAYIGTLWNLASVEPLVRGVRELSASEPELAARLELVFVGRRTERQERFLDEIRGGPCRVVAHPYLDHREAVELMKTAGGLCVLLSDLPGVERVVPAKIFECMAAARPIIAIAPRGEVWDLLKDYPAARLVVPANAVAIAEALGAEIRCHLEERAPILNGWRASKYDRRSQAGQLASILNAIVSNRN
jgi:glycosyltransferase involved in cell wall biosynthesis